MKEGYWGAVTSSVDWCEENYAYTFYIAEFWNTISSLAMVVLGMAGSLLHWQSLGWKLSVGYLFIIVVGIGSVLFHGTLQFEYQMWDEVPMIWTACYLLWLLLQEHGYSTVLSGVLMTVYSLLATYLTSQSNKGYQFYLFQTSFGGVMWACFWYVARLYRGVQKAEVRRIFHTGVFYLVTAISIWLFDKNLCYVYEFLPNPQLHAWWHVLMCVSLHYFFVGTGYEMLKHQNVRLGYLWANTWIPYIRVSPEKDQ